MTPSWRLGAGGVSTVSLDDVNRTIYQFERELVIRRIELKEDVPDKVGLYLSRLKTAEDRMRRQCNNGAFVKIVAMPLVTSRTRCTRTVTTIRMSSRRHGTRTPRCTSSPSKLWGNKVPYTKYIPQPYENEQWVWDGATLLDWKTISH